MRRTASLIPPMLVGDTPSPEMTAQRSKKSANAEIDTIDTKETPLWKLRKRNVADHPNVRLWSSRE